MDSGEAVDTWEPQAEKFVGPSFRFEDMESQDLRRRGLEITVEAMWLEDLTGL